MNGSKGVKTVSENTATFPETTCVPATQKPKRHWVANSKKSPMRRLKELWRKRFTEEEKDYWHVQFASRVMTQDEMRMEIRKRYNIHLTCDMQIARFRNWIKIDKTLLLKAELMKEYEKRL